MKITRKPWIVAAFCVTSAVFAQQSQPKQARPEEAGAKPAEKLCLHTWDKLSGSDVENLQGKKLGDVEDLLIQPGSGEVDYVIVARGGVLGVGEDLFAVPISLVQSHETKPGDDAHAKPVDDNEPKADTKADKEPRVVIDVSEERLKSAPAFKADEWPKLGLDFERRIHEHFGLMFRGDEAGGTIPAKPLPAGEDATAKTERRLLRASELVGLDVRAGAGEGAEKVGEISELAFDAGENRVAYLVLDADDFGEAGDAAYALPWSLLQCEKSEDGKHFLTTMLTSSQLARAPKFDKELQNRLDDGVWLEQLYAHYKVQPYWRATREAGAPKEPAKEPKGKENAPPPSPPKQGGGQ